MTLLRNLSILLLALLTIELSASGQTRADSLSAQLREEMADTVRSRLLFDLAEELGTADTALAFSSLEKGRGIAEAADDVRGLGRYYKIRGKIEARCGLYEEAILHLDRAMVYFNEADDQPSFFETIKEKGNVHLFRSEFPLAMNHYESALDYYRRSNNLIGISRCLNNIGIIHKNKGDYVEALSAYEESVAYLDSIRDAYDIAQANINMGNLFVYLGRYERALEYFGKALDIAERNNYRNIISLCLSNSGVIQNKIGNYAEALRLYTRSLDVSKALNDPVQQSNCLINMGTNFADMHEPEKALEYVQQGLDIKTALGDARTISNCYIHQADIYAMMQEYDRAIELYNRALRIKEDLDDPDGLIRCYLGLGSGAMEQGRHETAARMANLALEKALELRSMEYISSSYLLKNDIAVRLGDYPAAHESLIQHYIHRDSMMDEATTSAAIEMEFRMRSGILQQENENLKIQSSLDRLLVRRRTSRFYFILAIATVLLLALIMVVHYMRRHKRASGKLEEKNLVITKQNLKLDQLNKTKDRMMSIIAHDLRGTIGNQLTAVEVLNRIEGDEKLEIDRKSLLGNLKNSASYSLELLENLLHWSRLEEGASTYHPEEVKLNMLVSNCLSLYGESATNKNLSFETDMKETVSSYVDRVMMETIFRNLISNAIKFSKPGGRITIGLVKNDGMIHFRVEDQGIGMSPEEVQKVLQNGGVSRRGTANEKGAGMGLTLVREFTRIHNGELHITGKPGAGCRIEVVIPCIN